MSFLASLSTNDQNALKIAYSKREAAMFFDNRPTLGLLPKKAGGGLKYQHTMTIDLGQGVSSQFATAQADAANQTRKQMVIDWVERYSIASLYNTPLQLSKGAGTKAMVDLILTESESAINRLAESTERSLWKTGYGEIAQIATGGISSATITLTNRADIRNFTVGQKVTFASGISTGALRGTAGTQTLTVLSLVRDDGTGVAKVTFSANVSTLSGGGGSVAVGDYVFSNGDRQDNASPTPYSIAGIPGWIPITASASFMGIDQTVDRDLLAGVYTKGTNKSALEAVSDHLARMGEYGRKPDTLACTFDFANKLNKELLSKAEIELPGSGKAAGIIFTGFKFNGPTGPVNVVPIPACPANAFWALKTDTWSIISANDGGQLFENPMSGGKYLDVYNADKVELRNKFLGLLVCHDTSQNGVCQIA